MLKSGLQEHILKTRTIDGKIQVWDILRKKYVRLTPEENVRQTFINYLVEKKRYPAGLMMNEVPIELNGTAKRCDSVLFGKDMKPEMIMEYKAPTVAITQKTLEQIYRYNVVLKVRYLIITNGVDCYCCKVDYESNKCLLLDHIPDYDEL